MVAHRIRLAGIEYLICDGRQAAPHNGRLLPAVEFRRLLDTHQSSPRVRAMLAGLASGVGHARPEQRRHEDALGGRHQRLVGSGGRVIAALRCYELEPVIPKLAGSILEPSFPTAVPFEPSEIDEQAHWVEICVIGEDDQAIAGILCEITLPSGKVVRRSTDRFGLVRIEGITSAGDCSLTLPALDQSAWEPA